MIKPSSNRIVETGSEVLLADVAIEGFSAVQIRGRRSDVGTKFSRFPLGVKVIQLIHARYGRHRRGQTVQHPHAAVTVAAKELNRYAIIGHHRLTDLVVTDHVDHLTIHHVGDLAI